MQQQTVGPVMDYRALLKWIEEAPQGEDIVYYNGYLSQAAFLDYQVLRIASLINFAIEHKSITVVHKRADIGFEYHAIKTGKGSPWDTPK